MVGVVDVECGGFDERIVGDIGELMARWDTHRIQNLGTK